MSRTRLIGTYIARQQMRLACENDGEDLASRKCFTECQHQVISNRLHDLDGASELVVW